MAERPIQTILISNKGAKTNDKKELSPIATELPRSKKGNAPGSSGRVSWGRGLRSGAGQDGIAANRLEALGVALGVKGNSPWRRGEILASYAWAPGLRTSPVDNSLN